MVITTIAPPYPAQVTGDGKWTYTWPEIYTLVYQPDPYSGVEIQSTNNIEEVFRAVLDSIEMI